MEVGDKATDGIQSGLNLLNCGVVLNVRFNKVDGSFAQVTGGVLGNFNSNGHLFNFGAGAEFQLSADLVWVFIILNKVNDILNSPLDNLVALKKQKG